MASTKELKRWWCMRFSIVSHTMEWVLCISSLLRDSRKAAPMAVVLDLCMGNWRDRKKRGEKLRITIYLQRAPPPLQLFAAENRIFAAEPCTFKSSLVLLPTTPPESIGQQSKESIVQACIVGCSIQFFGCFRSPPCIVTAPLPPSSHASLPLAAAFTRRFEHEISNASVAPAFAGLTLFLAHEVRSFPIVFMMVKLLLNGGCRRFNRE
nr:hypothetical protein Iba_chr09aCG12340 [Ipomoea batatas]